MPLPSKDVLRLMKAVAWHQELAGHDLDMREWLDTHYPHASPYQRERAAALAFQAVSVGERLRELNYRDPLSAGLSGARRPAQAVGVRVRIDLSGVWPLRQTVGRPPPYIDEYIPMSWDQTVGDVGQAIRDALSVRYTEREIQAIIQAGTERGLAAEEAGRGRYTGQWWEFVGPTLFPVTDTSGPFGS